LRLEWLDRLLGGAGARDAQETVARHRSGVRAVTDAPLPRTSLWLLSGMLAFLVGALVWASVGRMDVTAFAQGRTVVSSRVQPVQSVERARVTQVLVDEGDRIAADEPVIYLERDSAQAEVESLQYRLHKARAARARLQGLLAALDSGGSPALEPSQELPERIVQGASQLMESQWRSYRETVDELRQKYRNQKAKLDTTREKIASVEAVLPYLRDRVQRLEKLLDKDATSVAELDKARQKLVSKEKELRVERQRLDEAQGQVDIANNALETKKTEFRAQRRQEIAEKSNEIARLERQLTAAQAKLERHTLRAPTGGIVQDLAVNLAGTVVEPSKVLMRVVPEDRPVEVRAKILNKDIGFAHEGQKVEVKFDAFDFTRYGAVPGMIRHISRTSTKEKEQGRVYNALVELERKTIEVNGRTVELRPGLTTTVDIDMGQRRIITYFLGPIMRYQDKALTER
jgi:hemolysin D